MTKKPPSPRSESWVISEVTSFRKQNPNLRLQLLNSNSFDSGRKRIYADIVTSPPFTFQTWDKKDRIRRQQIALIDTNILHLAPQYALKRFGVCEIKAKSSLEDLTNFRNFAFSTIYTKLQTLDRKARLGLLYTLLVKVGAYEDLATWRKVLTPITTTLFPDVNALRQLQAFAPSMQEMARRFEKVVARALGGVKWWRK